MDPISDFLIRLKNAGYANKDSISVPFSKIKSAIANVLSDKGYIGEVSIKGKTPKTMQLNVVVLYDNGRPRINDVNRISKPSRRMYEKAKNIKGYKKGYGLAVLSTPKGIMAHADAKKANVGGELLFTLW